MLYFFPALYLRRLSADEEFQEESGFLCRAFSPRIRCRSAHSAKLYSLSKDLAGSKPDAVVTVFLKNLQLNSTSPSPWRHTHEGSSLVIPLW
ncbi:hypothetical protein DPEC_G00033130 [Dallia pectoralis]|uniref:Uncharacterized protein n=1 Tax=Dallia pectoralis TaxID=75939 RepID=A0ACC2HCS7_DALPE|nr:hypothetical protein DPEC_G00033130 [Dallia pectoralis]